MGTSVPLLSGKDFLKPMKKEKRVCCVVIVKPKEETKEEVNMPTEVQELLEMYHYIVDNGFPSAFPPMMDSSH